MAAARRALVLLVALACAGGCAGGWRELRTRRITAYTDSPYHFAETLRQLEYAHAALSAFFPKVEVGPVEVLFLDYRRVLHAFGSERGGMVVVELPGAGKLGRRNLIVMGDYLATGIPASLLSHLFLHQVVPSAPLWLHQAMAQYLRTATVQHGGGTWRACFGFQPGRIRYFQLPLQQFFSIPWRDYPRQADSYDDTARLFIDFLFHGDGGAHRHKLVTIFAGAARGHPGPEIISKLFPDVTFDQLDRRLADFKGSPRTMHDRGTDCPLALPIPASALPDESSPRKTSLPDADVDELLAALQKLPHGKSFSSWYPPEVLTTSGR
jgi:hypothetical protein